MLLKAKLVLDNQLSQFLAVILQLFDLARVLVQNTKQSTNRLVVFRFSAESLLQLQNLLFVAEGEGFLLGILQL